MNIDSLHIAAISSFVMVRRLGPAEVATSRAIRAMRSASGSFSASPQLALERLDHGFGMLTWRLAASVLANSCARWSRTRKVMGRSGMHDDHISTRR